MKQLILFLFLNLLGSAVIASDCAECDALEKVAMESVYKSKETSVVKDVLTYLLSKNYSEVSKSGSEEYNALVPGYFSGGAMSSQSKYEQRKSELVKQYDLHFDSKSKEVLIQKYANPEAVDNLFNCLMNCINNGSSPAILYFEKKKSGDNNHKLIFRVNLSGKQTYTVVSSSVVNAKVGGVEKTELLAEDFVGYSGSTNFVITPIDSTQDMYCNLDIDIASQVYTLSAFVPGKTVYVPAPITPFFLDQRVSWSDGKRESARRVKCKNSVKGSKITFNELNGSLVVKADMGKSCATGKYTSKWLPVDEKATNIVIDFDNIKFSKSSPKGNATILTFDLVDEAGVLIARQQFKTADKKPLKSIPSFTLKGGVGMGKKYRLLVHVNDPWEGIQFSATVPKFRLIQYRK
jgi:hypothetical protein